MSPDTHPKVHAHPPTSPLLQIALRKHLPHSVPLVYRTKHANITADAHVLATFAPDEERGEVPGCWAVGYLDRSSKSIEGRGGQGEIFCYEEMGWCMNVSGFVAPRLLICLG